ncbi:MAG TPA: TIR domain-containing protein [Geminicoccaceae bacterium]|nr:TIR domain-containing protein [Geminicoccaceae bacterium]
MPDLFISYSRKDRDFVERLSRALVAAERDVWVDLDDILPTEDWLGKIRSGIEASNNFVFVISPDAVASTVCAEEVAHAVANHKRIIPLLHRPVPAEQVPAALAAINWLPFAGGDALAADIDALLRAVDINPEWVNAHTRLQVRALEWEQGRQDRSLLLRGRDLKDAEQWLIRSGVQEPKPTSLHTAYILASRHAETRRLRLSLGAIGFGLVVALALALVAFQQYRVASARLQVATSRELATHSLNQLDDRGDLALLLAIEATRVSDTFEARNSLLAALQAAPQVMAYLHGHRGPVSRMAFSPDGETLASGGADGMLRLWNVRERTPSGEPLTIRGTLGPEDEVRALAFSPDGEILAYGSMSGAFGLLQVASRTPLGEPIEFGGSVRDLAFLPDSRTLAVSNEVDFFLLDTLGWQRVGSPILGLGAAWRPDLDTRLPEAIIASADGKLLAFNAKEGIWLWDVAERVPVRDRLVADGEWITRLALSPDGTILAAGARDGIVRLWDVATGRQIGEPLPGNAGWVQDLAFSPDGGTLLWAGANGALMRWNLRRGGLERAPEAVGALRSVAISPDGQLLAIGGGDGSIRLRQLKDRNPLGDSVSDGRLASLAVGPDGDTLAAGGEHLRLWGIGRREQLAYLQDYDVLSLALDRAGGLMVSADQKGLVHFWDVAARQELGEPIRARQGYVWSVALTPDGRTVAAVGDDGIGLWDVATRTSVGTLGTGEVERRALAISPDGTILAAGGDGEAVELWDLASRRRLEPPLVGHAGAVWSLAFSTDGATLASGDDDGSVRLWDVRQRRPLPPLLAGHSGRVTALAFGPDGTMLASGGSERELLLIDLATRQALGRPLLPLAAYKRVTDLKFSPVDPVLIGGEADGGLSFLSIGLTAWIGLACRVANRNLRPEEWCRYRHDPPYRAACPGLPAPEPEVVCP